jgi:hypothetical protein
VYKIVDCRVFSHMQEGWEEVGRLSLGGRHRPMFYPAGCIRAAISLELMEFILKHAASNTLQETSQVININPDRG